VNTNAHARFDSDFARKQAVRVLYSGRTVIWFFDKNGEKLRYEIMRDRAAGRYRVVITRPDGSESVEEVDEPSQLIERSVQLMNSLRGDGWRVA
jgi:hypothetical protein